MCDYSAKSAKQRAATKDDVLISKSISAHTRGFVSATDPSTAVCLLPGTELAFDQEVKVDRERSGVFLGGTTTISHKVARFTQVEKNDQHVHHDTLEFPDGTQVKLNLLVEGQIATVLQLPAAPTTKVEAEKQRRAAYA